jgi:biofilm PGA synthesis lipoprotein PgaB
MHATTRFVKYPGYMFICQQFQLMRFLNAAESIRKIGKALIIAVFSFCWFLADEAVADNDFVVLSYHDVQDVVPKDLAAGQTAVSTENLIKQFDWLQDNGYHVVNVQALFDAQVAKKKLPEKSVLLTFDDGYASVFEKVFPLLKRYHYPAVIGLVGSWMESPVARGQAPAGLPVNKLLTWKQIASMQRSGLVEVASHSYDLHRGILGNPQGNEQPVGVTRSYSPVTNTYEGDRAYEARIRSEMRLSSLTIANRTGVRPRVMVWPYGEFNRPMVAAAREAGMTMTLALGDGKNSADDLSVVRRMLVAENPDINDFATMMRTLRIADRPLHVVHVDLDYIYDPDPVQTERNLDALVDRIQGMRVNTVYLQAYADADGDGNADALYFPNRHLPMRADLFNRVAWQLLTRARVKVYAWMPVLAYRVNAPDSWFVHEWKDGKSQLASHIYKRLSPFHPDARRIIGDIFEDLAKYSNFSGILFHDDAILSDFEDVTPEGIAWAKARDLPDNAESLRATSEMRMTWAKNKTAALVDWTRELAGKVRYYRPDIKTARNYYALPLLQPNSEEWFAQSFDSALAGYDYVAVEAMPFMEKAEVPEQWLRDLVKTVSARPDGLRKTVFEFQTVDWNTREKIPMATFLAQLKMVQNLGGINLGYYPDNVFIDHPRQEDMEEYFALPRFP